MGVVFEEVAALQLGREVGVSEDRVVAVVRDEKRAVVGDAKGHWIGSRNLHSERPHCGSWW